MTVHLLKLSVGSTSIESLAAWQARRLKQLGVLYHRTRHAPRRADEVLDGGSIYWIIKGYIRARQRITGFGEAMGRKGRPRCAFILDPKLVRTELVPHRPIQGWRYMEAPAAPRDLTRQSAARTSMPDEMEAELRALGLL